MRLIKTDLKPIQKICLSGLFLALVIVLQKVIAINYISFAPFIRISLGGPALIMFASIILGPIYGAFIGLGSDIIGYFIFDMSGFALYLQISSIYFLLGFVSYFVFCLIFMIKNKKIMAMIEIISFVLIWLAISGYVVFNNQITLFSSIYNIPLMAKILIPSISLLIFLGLIIFSLLYKGKGNYQYDSSLHICFASFICDFFIIVIYGSLMKAWAFGFQTFLAIILCQAITMFINVLFDTVFIAFFLRLSRNYICKGENDAREQ